MAEDRKSAARPAKSPAPESQAPESPAPDRSAPERSAPDRSVPGRRQNDRLSIDRRGMMFVLSSPSGAGKSTLSRRLLEDDPQIELSISATTRPARPGEVEGEHYFFLDKETFRARVEADEFLEHAEVFGNLYGTPRAPVEAALEQGRDVMFDIDWQGAQQLERSARNDLVRVFILPPSVTELERRLKARAQDSSAEVARRMAKSADEISHWAEYDYVIVNQELEQSHAQLQAILRAERLKRTRQVGLMDFVAKLRSSPGLSAPKP